MLGGRKNTDSNGSSGALWQSFSFLSVIFFFLVVVKEMSSFHFNLENEIQSSTRLDAPLGMDKGILQPRWQRKQSEGGLNSSGMLNNSKH